MRQQSFAVDGFEKYREKTRKEIFLEEMDHIILCVANCCSGCYGQLK